MSATPRDYEAEHSGAIVEQVVRPTGLVDPEVEVRPVADQVDDLLSEIRKVVEADKGATLGKEYQCPKPCALLKVTGNKGRRKVKLLMLQIKDEWKIDTKALDEFWELEKKTW